MNDRVTEVRLTTLNRSIDLIVASVVVYATASDSCLTAHDKQTHTTHNSHPEIIKNQSITDSVSMKRGDYLGDYLIKC